MIQRQNQEQTTTAQILNNFSGHPVHIFGVTGAEGSAVLRWCIQHDLPRIVAHDVLPHEQLLNEWHRVHEGATDAEAAQFESDISHASVRLALADQYETDFGAHDIIFLPQSWFRYERNNFLRQFFTSTLSVQEEFITRIWTLTRLYFSLFPGKILAVTGSDGKTTTTRLLGAIMTAYAEAHGVTCIESGNDRMHTQSLSAIEAAHPEDFLVLEVSDRQLSFAFPFAPDVAVVTNITANKHMDDYGGFEHYAAVKSHLIAFQEPDQTAILNADDPASAQLVEIGQGMKRWFSTRTSVRQGAMLHGEDLLLMSENASHRVASIGELQLMGEHNYANLLAAAAAAVAVGVPAPLIHDALASFKAVRHRLEPVGTWHGITFIEDSAGGNPVNVAATVRTFSKHNLVLLVGGYRPHVTAAEVSDMLAALASATHVHTLILFGQVRHDLAALVLDATRGSVSVVMVEGLAEAFGWVQEHAAELQTLPAPVVCMTPGFESFDQYKDYRARAAHFVALVKSLC